MTGHCNYIVTAQETTAINAAVKGHFTSPTDLNLIIAKNSRLEVHIITPDGLVPKVDLNIYGQIALMKLFRPPGEKQDLLFILTQRYRSAILAYKPSTGDIITKAYGDVKDKIGHPNDSGMIGIIDPQCKMIALHIYNGLLKIIPLDLGSNGELKAFNIRLEELCVVDIQFLNGFPQPTIILVYQDAHGRHVKTYGISLADKEFTRGPWKQDNVELEASMLIAVPKPMEGALIIGHESITYHKGEHYHAVAPPAIKQSSLTCYCRVDEGENAPYLRYLLGDSWGRIFMLYLDNITKPNGQVEMKDCKVELLGEASIPHCLAYLDNRVVFVGSLLGDSQLIQLNNEPDGNGSFISVIHSFTNLGPILDMCVVDLEHQGQGQLVTVSGAYKEGTLRVIRNGIGIDEHATIDLDGIITGIWSLKIDDQTLDDTIILSFVGYSRTLKLSGEEVEEVEIEGFHSHAQTTYCANTIHKQFIQVTDDSIRLINCSSKQLVSEWKSAEKITIATSNNDQVLVSLGKKLVYLEVTQGSITQISETTIEYEVACVDISPKFTEKCEAKSERACIGLWTDISIRVLSLPNLEQLSKETLDGEMIPRSILMTTFEDNEYILCATGDGCLFYFKFQRLPGLVSEQKKVTLGTKPTVLQAFKSGPSMHVFACSDRPTVIYSSNNKLVFSNVNLKEVSHIAPLNTEAYPNSFAIADTNLLKFGSIDEIQQKLHIRTVALHESPRRIVHQDSTETFGVISSRTEIRDPNTSKRVAQRQSASLTASSITYSSGEGASQQGVSAGSSKEIEGGALGMEMEVFSFLVLDQHTFEVSHAHQLLDNEWATSVTTCQFNDDPNTYYCVGTAMVYPEEAEPKEGRILLLQLIDGKLIQVYTKTVKGAVHAIQGFNGKLLTCINSMVTVWEWTSEKELKQECCYHHMILALYLKTKGDFILVGDLTRSVTLLVYKPIGRLEEIGHDSTINWMTAVEIIDDGVFLGAETSFNLFVCEDNSSASDEERHQLDTTGVYHLGGFVNVFCHGSLVMDNSGEQTTKLSSSILYGTVTGSIGLVAGIPQSTFEFLSKVQSKLTQVIKSVGKIEHSFWRSFYNERREECSKNCIDGDLIESSLCLSKSQLAEVVHELEIEENGAQRRCTVEDLERIVEELKRLH